MITLSLALELPLPKNYTSRPDLWIHNLLLSDESTQILKADTLSRSLSLIHDAALKQDTGSMLLDFR